MKLIRNSTIRDHRGFILVLSRYFDRIDVAHLGAEKPFYQVKQVILLPAQSISQQMVETRTRTKLPPTTFMDNTFARTLAHCISQSTFLYNLDRQMYQSS